MPKRLPQILSREEVARLIKAGATLRGRALLSTTYAAGGGSVQRGLSAAIAAAAGFFCATADKRYSLGVMQSPGAFQ